MTMTKKTRYMTPPLVLKETESKFLEIFASCIHFYHYFISEKNPRTMEEVFLRFPHLSENIFGSLNCEFLAKSKEVCRSWYLYLDDQKFLEIKANKVKLVIKTVKRLGHVAKVYQPYHQLPEKSFSIKTRKAMVDDARNGNFDLVHKKIMQNLTLLYYPMNPFLDAAVSGHFVVAKYLVDNALSEHDKNPFIDASYRGTPLHIASVHGRIDIVKYIMSNIRDVNPKDWNGDTPLHYAARGNKPNINGNKLEVVQYIMEKLEDNCPKNHTGKTPLHVAAAYGQLDIFKYIIENVFEKNPEDVNGNTPIDLASEGKYWEIVTVASKYLNTE